MQYVDDLADLKRTPLSEPT